MKKAILGTKVGMTQMFREDGTMIPVTVVLAGPCPVVQIKTTGKDGYEAVQVAFGPVREKLITKPELGHLKKAGVAAHRYVREFKLDDTATYEVGQVIKADVFANGDKVDVTGKSKGKDERDGKLTAVSVWTLEGAQAHVRSELARAERALDGFGAEADFFRALADEAARRDH